MVTVLFSRYSAQRYVPKTFTFAGAGVALTVIAVVGAGCGVVVSGTAGVNGTAGAGDDAPGETEGSASMHPADIAAKINTPTMKIRYLGSIILTHFRYGDRPDTFLL
ncbi:MAG: hypothetical protein WCX22_12910 [Methanoregula sp.]